MIKTDSLEKVIWLPTAMHSYSLGKKWGMERSWVGRMNTLFVQLEFVLIFEKPMHFCITLKINYENKLLMKMLTKRHLFACHFQDSKSFALKH